MLVTGGARRKRAATKVKKLMGGESSCGTTDYGTFQPTTGDNSFMYGLPSSDIGGATAASANCSINAASQIATSISPVVPSYAVVDFGQGENDPISPAGAAFMGGAKKKRKGKKAAGKKTKKTKTTKKKTKKVKCPKECTGSPTKAKKGKAKATSDGKSLWALTEFRVKITTSEGKKVVKSLFFNATTGEYRLRKMIKKGRKKVARFSPVPKAAEFVR